MFNTLYTVMKDVNKHTTQEREVKRFHCSLETLNVSETGLTLIPIIQILAVKMSADTSQKKAQNPSSES